jgi:hypothetical protein
MDVMPGHTAVAMLSGVVAVSARGAPGGEVVLQQPGQGTDVRTGQAPTPPTVWGAHIAIVCPVSPFALIVESSTWRSRYAILLRIQDQLQSTIDN